MTLLTPFLTPFATPFATAFTTRCWRGLRAALGLCAALLGVPAHADEAPRGPLVTAAWLQRNLADTTVLDASFTSQHRAGHIPGAISADLVRYGVNAPTPAVMQQRLRSWGISPGRKVVIYDQGGDMLAPRLYFDLHYHGVPAADVFILDGGLAQWRALGGGVTQEATPAPTPGTIGVTALREESRVRFAEFFAASGDRTRHALVEALDPPYHFGQQKFFDRPGHVPGAILMPGADFYNADKTFKSAPRYALGHVPFALNLPAETFRAHLGQPGALAQRLGPAGVHPDHEVVLVSDGGLTPDAALAFVAFEQLGHAKVSVLMDSVDEWGLRGFPLSKEPTLVGTPKTPQAFAVSAAIYPAAAPTAPVLVSDSATSRGVFPQVFVAAGKTPPTRSPQGSVRRPPYTALLNADGTPKPAGDLWKLFSDAGIPRHAELVFFADDPAEAAVNYVVFKLMGWPDIKVLRD